MRQAVIRPQNLLTFFVGQLFSVEDDADGEIHEAIESDLTGRFLSNLHLDFRRGDRFAFHQSGTRTTRPASSS